MKIQFDTDNWIITAERKVSQSKDRQETPQVKEKKRFEPVRQSTELDLTKFDESLDLLQTPIKQLDDSISTTSSSKAHNISLPNPPVNRPIIYSDLHLRELKPGRHPIVISHANPGKKMFSVMESSDELGNFLKSIARAIRKCEKNDFPSGYEPKCEEMVLAQFQGTYYRACVIDKIGQDYIVLFVDFGNQDCVKINQMKPFNKSLMMDLIVNDVYFRNLPVPLTKQAKTILRTENGVQIDVKKQRTAEGCYIADLIGL